MVTRKRIRRLERFYTGSILPGLETYFGDRKDLMKSQKDIPGTGKIIGRLERYYYHEDWTDVPEAGKLFWILGRYY